MSEHPTTHPAGPDHDDAGVVPPAQTTPAQTTPDETDTDDGVEEDRPVVDPGDDAAAQEDA